MTDLDIDGALDLRLMKITLQLLKERSVSRVAAQLSLSQPAVSQLLRRARQVFGDQLLVRNGQQMVLTARGEEVLRHLERALAPLLAAISPGASFDPAVSQKRFQISILSGFAEYLIPPIAHHINTQSPHAAIEFSTPRSVAQIARELGAGELDLVIGNWPDPPAHLRFFALCSFPFGCVVRREHPLARQALDIENYLAARHVAPDSSYEATMGPVKGRLWQMGLSRNVVVRLSDYQHIPTILRQNDLIFTTVLPYAQDIARKSNGELVALAAPPEFRRTDLYMLWHERNQTNGEHSWLRDSVKAAAAEMLRIFRGPLPEN